LSLLTRAVRTETFLSRPRFAIRPFQGSLFLTVPIFDRISAPHRWLALFVPPADPCHTSPKISASLSIREVFPVRASRIFSTYPYNDAASFSIEPIRNPRIQSFALHQGGIFCPPPRIVYSPLPYYAVFCSPIAEKAPPPRCLSVPPHQLTLTLCPLIASLLVFPSPCFFSFIALVENPLLAPPYSSGLRFRRRTCPAMKSPSRGGEVRLPPFFVVPCSLPPLVDLLRFPLLLVFVAFLVFFLVFPLCFFFSRPLPMYVYLCVDFCFLLVCRPSFPSTLYFFLLPRTVLTLIYTTCASEPLLGSFYSD